MALVILGLVVTGFLETFAGALRASADGRTWAQALVYAEDGQEGVKIEGAVRGHWQRNPAGRRVHPPDHVRSLARRGDARNRDRDSPQWRAIRARSLGLVPMKRCGFGERGVALALVLWLVVLLGAVAATVVASTRGATNIVLNARARTVARYAAESGIVAGVAVLEHRLATEAVRRQHVLPFDGIDRELAGLSEPSPLANAQI